MHLYSFLVLLVPSCFFIASLISLLFAKHLRRVQICGGIIIFASFISIMLTSVIWNNYRLNDSIIIHLFEWVKLEESTLNLNLLVDPFGLSLSITIDIIMISVLLFAIFLRRERRSTSSYFTAISFLLGLLHFIIFTDNLFLFIFLLEGVVLINYFLVEKFYFGEKREKVERGVFCSGHVAQLFLFLGSIGLLQEFGGTSLSHLVLLVHNNSSLANNLTISVFLILTGVVINLSQIPFCSWRIDSSELPFPVMNVLNTLVPVVSGAYLLGRLSTFLSLISFGSDVLVILGVLTCFINAVIMVFQAELKKVIVYMAIFYLSLISIVLSSNYLQEGIYLSLFFLIVYTTQTMGIGAVRVCTMASSSQISGVNHLEKSRVGPFVIYVAFLSGILGQIAFFVLPNLSFNILDFYSLLVSIDLPAENFILSIFFVSIFIVLFSLAKILFWGIGFRKTFLNQEIEVSRLIITSMIILTVSTLTVTVLNSNLFDIIITKNPSSASSSLIEINKTVFVTVSYYFFTLLAVLVAYLFMYNHRLRKIVERSRYGHYEWWSFVSEGKFIDKFFVNFIFNPIDLVLKVILEVLEKIMIRGVFSSIPILVQHLSRSLKDLRYYSSEGFVLMLLGSLAILLIYIF